MAKPKVIALTDNVRTKKLLQKVVTATGCILHLADHPSALTDNYQLLIWDFRAGSAPSADTLAKANVKMPILVLLQGQEISHVSDVWNDDRCKCLMAYRNDDLNESELIVSITKLVKGDIFGLQKYFTWGVTLYSMKVYNYREKVIAIDIVDEAAKLAGCRRPVRQRIGLAADELLINALYHSPVDQKGAELYGEMVGDERVTIDLEEPVVVRYATDGRCFAIGVRDAHGSLSKERLLRYLTRSADNKAEMESKKTGAGLGLHEVLRSVSGMAWNLSPGTTTEVICLFEMEPRSGATSTRSMSIFVEEQQPAIGSAASRDNAQRQMQLSKLYLASAGFLFILLAIAALFFGLLPSRGSVPLVLSTSLKHATLYLNGARAPGRLVAVTARRGSVATFEVRYRTKLLLKLTVIPRKEDGVVEVRADLLPWTRAPANTPGARNRRK